MIKEKVRFQVSLKDPGNNLYFESCDEAIFKPKSSYASNISPSTTDTKLELTSTSIFTNK